MSQHEHEAVRVPLIAGNWKMFKTSGEGATFVRDLAKEIGEVHGREVVVAPPFTGLYEAVKAAHGTSIMVAAQDVFWEWEGAFTGEVSATMLADLGVKAAIIGHSERRRYFSETDESVAKKVWAALEQRLLPIMCVGETEDDLRGLRACLGNRHRTYGHSGGRARSYSFRARAGGGHAWQEGGRVSAHTLWGERRPSQHR
jgi:triosephosphate isomerase